MSGGAERYDSRLDEYRGTAHVSNADLYRDLYQRALTSPEEFWAEEAQQWLSWEKQWDRVVRSDFERGRIEWFSGGMLHAADNYLDRHLDRLHENPAYYWQADDPAESVAGPGGDPHADGTGVAGCHAGVCSDRCTRRHGDPIGVRSKRG